jgi:hypothetical protein
MTMKKPLGMVVEHADSVVIGWIPTIVLGYSGFIDKTAPSVGQIGFC